LTTPASHRRMDRPSPRSPAAGRETSIDALRGLVMIVMALDHVRDFVHVGAMSFSPEDLARTTPMLFFTRWITHICAPTFVLLAGVGVGLRLARSGSRAAVSRYLWTRGLWLVFLELFVMRLLLTFRLSPADPTLLLVLWAIGLSMIVMAALIYLPTRWLLAGSVAMIALHNVFDGIQAASWGRWAPVWNVLHQQGAFSVYGVVVVTAYSLVPWVAVMALGFCLAGWVSREPSVRQRGLWRVGGALLLAFVVIRAINLYGDPAPWSSQATGAMTVVSFFRVTKYPASLSFLLMTLGLAFLAWGWLQRRQPHAGHPLVVIGRVPLFYFLVHFGVAHLAAVALAFIRYGPSASAFAWLPLPSIGGDARSFPPDFGFDLWVVYAVWIAVVAVVYPLCRWFAGVKARRQDWWWGYL